MAPGKFRKIRMNPTDLDVFHSRKRAFDAEDNANIIIIIEYSKTPLQVVPVAGALLEAEKVGKSGCVGRDQEVVGLVATGRDP